MQSDMNPTPKTIPEGRLVPQTRRGGDAVSMWAGYHVVCCTYGWLSALNTRCRIIIGIPKRDHNVDNHPYACVHTYIYICSYTCLHIAVPSWLASRASSCHPSLAIRFRLVWDRMGCKTSKRLGCKKESGTVQHELAVTSISLQMARAAWCANVPGVPRTVAAATAPEKAPVPVVASESKASTEARSF